jgi:spore coat protein SA
LTINSKKLTIAIISPGRYSIPPVIGTSVEHDIEMVGKAMSPHRVVIYTRTCKEYPTSTRENHQEYRRIPYRKALSYLRLVIKDIKKLDPDIILVENRPSYISVIKKHLINKPIVLNMHSLTFISPKLISKNRARRAMKLIDGLITNSDFLKNEYIRLFPEVKKKAYGVHLGIHPLPSDSLGSKKNEEIKKKYGINNSDKILLFVGRILEGKGVHHLVKAAKTIIQEDPSVKLLIVGSPKYGRNTSTQYFDYLKKEASSLKENILFTHFIKPADIKHYLQLADIVITPSVGKEAFCRVNLEAMSAGKPVITTDIGGIPEVVRHNETGYVLPVQTLSKSLPIAIKKLVNSENIRKEMGEQGLRHIQNFTWEKTATAYLQIFESILSKQI